MKYKHIIFDIDGTLLDSGKADLCALQETLEIIQHQKMDIEDLYFALGIPGEFALQKLGIKNTKEVNELWQTLFSKHFHSVKLFEGITEILDQLTQTECKLGIVTSKNPAEFAHDFSPFGITRYFEIILCSTDYTRPKPYPDPLTTYLDRAGISAEEVIYIGDTLYDMECSKASGVDFGLAVWGSYSKEKIKAEYYFNTPEDIIKLLRD